MTQEIENSGIRKAVSYSEAAELRSKVVEAIFSDNGTSEIAIPLDLGETLLNLIEEHDSALDRLSKNRDRATEIERYAQQADEQLISIVGSEYTKNARTLLGFIGEATVAIINGEKPEPTD